MSVSREEFLRRYSQNLLEGSAAVFVGAGFSIPAGFVDWRTLLREIATDLGLDVDLEHDLIAVAQYELNRKGSRDTLDEAIVRKFARDATETENHRLLARLPVDTVWTTNYDQLIENVFRSVGKRVDVKIAPEQLRVRKPHVDATIFKMHGDADHSYAAVITKDDYECYEAEKGAFTVQLLADLLSKRFVFIGFSFTDPNIEYTFNRLRRLLNPHRRENSAPKEHYCILRKPALSDYVDVKGTDVEKRHMHERDMARLKHRVGDMKRLGVQAVLIDDYQEITELLQALNRRVNTRKVMFSGAAHDFSPFGEKRLEEFCRRLGRALIEKGYDIISGVGKGISAAIMIGAQEALARPDAGRLGDRLKLFPFPYWYPDETKRTEYYRQNRREMAAQAGATIVIAGNKMTPDGLIESTGVWAELDEAGAHGHYIIPIGATGHAAQTVWKALIASGDSFPSGVKAELAILGDIKASDDALIAAVLAILEKIRTAV